MQRSERPEIWQVIAASEKLRQEVASLLHGAVQSRLTVCELKLAKVEKDLAAVEVSHVTPSGSKTVSDARSWLVEVQAELRQLRRTHVQEAIQKLYPSLLSHGLRVALDLLVTAHHLNDRIKLVTDDRFAAWDCPTDDEETAATRLAVYRLVEGVLRAVAAWPERITCRLRLSGDEVGDGPLIIIDVETKEKSALAGARSFQLNAADAARFECVGGVLRCSPQSDKVFLRGILPLKNFSLDEDT